jgi:hypothetical protein
VGLGGRDRRAASHAERARLNVTRAIRAAMANLARANPALGRHLAATIRTGRYCAYTPDPRAPLVWNADLNHRPGLNNGAHRLNATPPGEGPGGKDGMMRIGLTGIFADDQDRAEQFYAEVLGFQVKTSAAYGPGERWLSVVAPEDPDGVELVLHLADEPARAGTVALSRNVPGKPGKVEALLHGRAPRRGRTTRPCL